MHVLLRLKTKKDSNHQRSPYYNAAPQLRYVPTQFRANFVCILLLANGAISFASTLLSVLELMCPGNCLATDLRTIQ